MIARLSSFVLLILVGHDACHPTSMRFDQAQQKATVLEHRAAELPPPGRQSDAALEATVGNLQALDRRAAPGCGQPSHSCDAQQSGSTETSISCGSTPGRAATIVSSRSVSNTSTGGSQFGIGTTAEAGLKELTMQLFRPLDHGAGFSPHPASRIGRSHRTCPLTGSAYPGLDVQTRSGIGSSSELGRSAGHGDTLACRAMPMAAARSSNSYDPSCRRPLMKNVGVPFTPLRTPPRKSLRTLGAYSPLISASRRSASDKSECSSEREQERQAEAILVLVDAVVHLPEPAMRARKLGTLGGGFGIGMDLSHRKMAKDKSQPLAEMLLDKLDDRMRQPAIPAFVVAVFDQRDRRVRRPEDMISRRDGRLQRGHGFALRLAASPARRECRRRRD